MENRKAAKVKPAARWNGEEHDRYVMRNDGAIAAAMLEVTGVAPREITPLMRRCYQAGYRHAMHDIMAEAARRAGEPSRD